MRTYSSLLGEPPLPPRCGAFVALAGAPGDFVRPLYATATRVRLFECAGGARALSRWGSLRPYCWLPATAEEEEEERAACWGRGAAETSSLFLLAVSISRSDHACRMHACSFQSRCGRVSVYW